MMKATICELREEPAEFEQDWQALADHVRGAASNLVVLPEMTFCPWFARSRAFDPAVWQAAVSAHDAWLARLADLAPATVVGSRPVNDGTGRFNEGFVWSPAGGYVRTHRKYYLPDDEGFWEASWYQRGDGGFAVCETGALRIGFMICTEQWFLEHARAYGRAGAQLIVTPRATLQSTVDKWLVGGRANAICSGAYSLSSNRVSGPGRPDDLGGQGWAVDPDGVVLALTSRARPFATVTLDLTLADLAKTTYPRYVAE